MHAWLAAWVPTLVVLHVLSAFAFVLVHGPSIAAMFALRHERELARVQALLEMSRRWSAYSWGAWVFLAGTGALLAFAGHRWGAPWVWGSAVVLVLVSGIMSPLAARRFNEARACAGLPWFDGKGVRPPGIVQPEGLRKALADIRDVTPVVTAIGAVGLALLVGLMVLRPG